MSDLKLTYLGESGTHYILKLEDEDGFIGIGQIRKAWKGWADKYYWDDIKSDEDAGVQNKPH